ncbi:hypothetical protein U3516DRAFT_791982 [Neocallimastix sp. 'constans']
MTFTFRIRLDFLKRLYWADCARNLSMFGIILLHSAGYGCEKTLLKRKDSNLKIICFYNCITRFGLCVFWGSLIPTLKNIFSSYQWKEAQDELNTWTSRWHYHFTLEFVGYFVAGYHIIRHVHIESLKIRWLLYVLGLADIFLIFGMTYRLEMKTGRYSKDFRDSYTLTVAFYTVVLFIFFKHEIGRINFSERAIRIISKLSALTFGIYLSHMILKGLLSRYVHIKQEEFLGIKLSSPIGCPIFWIVISGSSLFVSYLLSITPILKNYVI